MKKIITILLLALAPISLIAQSHKPDSLLKALGKATTDSSRFFINTALASHYVEEIRDSAMYYTRTSLALAEKNDKQLNKATALFMKGYIFYHQTNYGEAYRNYVQALTIAENAQMENKVWLEDAKFSIHDWRLSLLAGLHVSLHILKQTTSNYKSNLINLYEARRLFEETRDTMGMAETYKHEAWNNLGRGKFDSANVHAEKAFALYKIIRSTASVAEVYMVKGTVAIEKRNYKAGLEQIHTALYWAYDDNDLDDVMKCYKLLTDLYLSKSIQKDSSLKYAKKYLETLQRMGSAKLGLAYLNMYKAYKLNDNTDSAYKFIQLASVARDSTYERTINSLSEFQNLSFEDQFRIQALEQEKIQTRNQVRTYSLMTGLAIFLVVGFVLYRNNRHKQKANELLKSTLTNLKSTQAQLIQSEKMASLGELTAGIAHEIQNPLNFVNNFSEVNNELIDEMGIELDKGDIAEAKAIAQDVKQNLEKIAHHGKRADAIVKGMLQHSRSNSGQKEPTDINALADEYLRLSYHGLRAKDKSFNASMHTHFDETIGMINIIPQDIGRVLLNLFTNAFYSVADKNKQQNEVYQPTVSITTKKVADRIHISVRDNGTGIPQKVKDKIFQPFFTTKPTGEGTGLGLSLSYDIITKGHGGELKIISAEEGAEFLIQLPLS